MSREAGLQSNSEKPVRFDLSRMEGGIRQLLEGIGEDPNREGILDTPRRVARAYAEMLSGLDEDPAVHLARTFEQDSEDLVCLRDIEFVSMCEHHLLPVLGKAHIAYLPSNRRVVGLSKLARTVDVFARRPQLQERLTAQVADALMEHLGPVGVVVAVEAEHMCMRLRGVKKDRPVMTTTAFRGIFATDRPARAEVLGLLGLGSHRTGSTLGSSDLLERHRSSNLPLNQESVARVFPFETAKSAVG
jgi:GTP cyclohydrolase IA